MTFSSDAFIPISWITLTHSYPVLEPALQGAAFGEWFLFRCDELLKIVLSQTAKDFSRDKVRAGLLNCLLLLRDRYIFVQLRYQCDAAMRNR